MLIHIASPITDLQATDEKLLTEALSALARSHRLGHHVLVIKRELSQWIADHVDLSKADKSIIREIGQNYTQNGNLIDRARFFMSVNAGPRKTIQKHDTHISVSLDYFADTALAEPTVFLVEDAIGDGRLYEFILKNLTPAHPSKHPSFELAHGGGDRVDDIFGIELDKGRFVACLIDSDRKALCDAEPAKITRLKRISAEKSPLSNVHCTPGMEAENFVPISVFLNVNRNYDKKSAKHLLEIEDKEEPTSLYDRYWLYFDVKMGTDKAKLGNITTEGWAEWIEKKLELTFAELDEVELSGFGDQILRNLFRSEEHLELFRQELRKRTWRDLFWDIFDELLWLFFGSKRQVT